MKTLKIIRFVLVVIFVIIALYDKIVHGTFNSYLNMLGFGIVLIITGIIEWKENRIEGTIVALILGTILLLLSIFG